MSKIKKTASGPGNTPYCVWTDNALFLAPVVTFIWNLSLCSYSWPVAWKESNISPLSKVNTPSQHQDFRGINVTPVIARCFEKIVYHKFSKHAFEENLSSTQYAYREGCNCTDALIKMQYNCWKALDDRECRYVRLFAMDLAKVFDNVKHSILSDKLKALNLNPYITNWYLSFLRNCKQRLVFRSSSYCWYNVNKGTTQGSVSGPYLFNLFLNDLYLVNCLEASLSKYADDTTMQDVVNKAENDCASDVISQYLSWSSTNGIPCNLSKCKESSKRLRTQTSLLTCVNTERFKATFINRLYFNYTLTF